MGRRTRHRAANRRCQRVAWRHVPVGRQLPRCGELHDLCGGRPAAARRGVIGNVGDGDERDAAGGRPDGRVGERVVLNPMVLVCRELRGGRRLRNHGVRTVADDRRRDVWRVGSGDGAARANCGVRHPGRGARMHLDRQLRGRHGRVRVDRERGHLGHPGAAHTAVERVVLRLGRRVPERRPCACRALRYNNE